VRSQSGAGGRRTPALQRTVSFVGASHSSHRGVRQGERMTGKVFPHSSLRKRFLLLTMLTSGIGVLLGCSVFYFYDSYGARERKAEEMRSVADLVGTNSAASLAFDDPLNGAKLLDALATRENIRTGVLYRKDGSFFASYVRPGWNGRLLIPGKPVEGI